MTTTFPLRFLVLGVLVASLGCVSKTPVNVPLVDPMKDAAAGHELRLDKIPEFRLSAGDVLTVLYGIRDELRPKYGLQIRDELEIKFPNLPTLDSTQQVRPDGKITLPYIGDVSALGKSPAELMTDVREAYRGTLREPEVFISVKKFDAATEELLKAVSSSDNGPVKRIIVRPDGGATFPLVGDLPVAGMTLKELSESLSAEYGRHYDRLAVDVALAESDSMRVFVLGEVKSPGGYRMDRPRTALEAVALAGGQTIDGMLDQVMIMRVDGQTVNCRVVDLTDPLSMDKNGEIPIVAPGDVIYVSRSTITDLAYLATRIGTITFFRGASMSFSYQLHDTSSGTKTIVPTPQ